MNKKNKGFTLIELLVVIAIIGILASLVLVALGNARSKAQDARIKSNIGQLRTLAEVIYDNNNSKYTTVEGCFGSDAGATDANCKGVQDNVLTIRGDAVNAGSAITAESTDTAYCVQSALNSVPANRFCADSTGAAKIVTAACTAAGACP